ncbi:heavy metal sensor histidine kinase [Ramlibacter sp. WS9]|uniref:heavy metal sensor histidine kinase n=1 Tax=Ramlibacter sp. WS9 TaxID=1882741 RepID=UPI001143E60C|nr:heavy metal sensor histidine kinase [Ramlibacter sp. WS9]ROZ74358.1 HAMP domain-containing protein [Ramlibacter sp. WS9]
MKKAGYSLARRLSMQLAWQTALGLGLFCAGIFAATQWSFEDKQRTYLAAKLTATRDVALSAERAGGLAEMRKQLQTGVARRVGTYLELHAADGELLYRDPEVPQGFAKAQRLDFVLPLAAGDARGVLLLDTAEDSRMLGRLALILLAATLLGGLSAGLASAWRVRRTLRPLRTLADQTRAISPERMDQRLSLAEPVAELQPWIDQFNAMLRRLESAYVQLEAFNADVAHELRTPLAALIGHTEVALSREDRPAEALRETLTGNLEELQRFAALVNDMLFLSRADRGATARCGAPSRLADLVRQVVDFHEAPLSEAQLRVDVEGDAELAVDQPLFKRAVSNLLGNATRYAARGSAITVHIGLDAQGRAEVAVENTGPDIDALHIPRLFDRFFRTDESRADGHVHHGLGLAIVAAIARMHSGHTMAVSGEGRTRIGFAVNRTPKL